MTGDILVTGATGQVGTELLRLNPPPGWTLVGADRQALDLADAAAIEAVIASRPWAAVVNTAAYTQVDRAETETDLAWRINAEAPGVLAVATARRGIPLVHVSTDYVFDGARDGAWRIDDPVNPLNAYGASKEAGEQAVRSHNPRHAIVRTAWVFSAQGTNFMKTMLRLAAANDAVRVVGDQRGAPTSASDLAAALLTMAIRLAGDDHAPTGTFHFSNAGEVSWAGFAREIFAGSAVRGGPSAEVQAITTADYPTPARRPANSVLDLSRLEAWQIHPRHWREALADVLDDLVKT